MSGYFDNSATTKPCPQAVEIFNSLAENRYGNPASLHSMGIKSHIEVEKAREIIANQIFCQSNEIFFTSGGTQSNNMAILGASLANRRRGNKIVITSIEHPSVSRTADFLSENGFEVIRLTVLPNGDFIDEEVEQAFEGVQLRCGVSLKVLEATVFLIGAILIDVFHRLAFEVGHYLAVLPRDGIEETVRVLQQGTPAVKLNADAGWVKPVVTYAEAVEVFGGQTKMVSPVFIINLVQKVFICKNYTFPVFYSERNFSCVVQPCHLGNGAYYKAPRFSTL